MRLYVFINSKQSTAIDTNKIQAFYRTGNTLTVQLDTFVTSTTFITEKEAITAYDHLYNFIKTNYPQG